MIDPIVDEIRRFRDAHAAKFGYDIHAIVKDLQEEEKKSGLKFVSYASRQPESTLDTPPIEETGQAHSAAK